jgi:hypothetical protein
MRGKSNAAKINGFRWDELVGNNKNAILTLYTVEKNIGKLVQVGKSLVLRPQWCITGFSATKTRQAMYRVIKKSLCT